MLLFLEGVVKWLVHVSISMVVMVEGIVVVILQPLLIHGLHLVLQIHRPPHPHEIHRRHVVAAAAYPPHAAPIAAALRRALEEPRRQALVHQHPAVHRHVARRRPASAVEEVRRHLLRSPLLHQPRRERAAERRRLLLAHVKPAAAAAVVAMQARVRPYPRARPGIRAGHGGADEVLLHHGGVGGGGPHLRRLLQQGGGRHLGRAQILVLMAVPEARRAGIRAELEARGGGGHRPRAAEEVAGGGGEHSGGGGHVHGLEGDGEELLRHGLEWVAEFR